MNKIHNKSRRFSGIINLYGDENFNKLSSNHICVVGTGGVGSWCVEALARTGISKITIIDLDHVTESNVNRQIQALTSNFGKSKVMALKERVLDINPNCKLFIIEDFINEQNINTIFKENYDYIIDAIDEFQIKLKMIIYFLKNKKKFIVSGNAGGKTNPKFIKTDDLKNVTNDKMLSKIRYKLRKNFGFNKTKKMGIKCIYSNQNVILPPTKCNSILQGLSCSGYGSTMLVTASFGLHIVTNVINDIIKI